LRGPAVIAEIALAWSRLSDRGSSFSKHAERAANNPGFECAHKKKKDPVSNVF